MSLARKTVLPASEVSPRLTLAPGTISDWRAVRRGVDAHDANDDVLHDRTIKWLATLPADVRPIVTGQWAPRIVNRIGDLWSQCEYTRLHFQSLLVDRRQGRQGFPPEVRREIAALEHYYFEHLSGLPAILWNAVPVHPPWIPDRVFGPRADTTEIDILPLKIG